MSEELHPALAAIVSSFDNYVLVEVLPDVAEEPEQNTESLASYHREEYEDVIDKPAMRLIAFGEDMDRAKKLLEGIENAE